MKKVYLIGGPMGVGKTVICNKLNEKLNNSIFLDGDWCWNANPFIVTDETKKMVEDNICYLLNNFIACSSYENIIFCWVMHQQDIIDSIVNRLKGDIKVIPISLVCSKEELINRLNKDINDGIRTSDVIDRSLDRLTYYKDLKTIKLDRTGLNILECVEKIMEF